MAVNVIGVRFREAAKIYYFAPPEDEVYVGEYVVVPTAHGEEMARIVITPEPDAGPVPHDVKPINRLASADDRARALTMRDRGDGILQRMRTMLSELELELELSMYVSAVQINLTGSEATAFFEADEHIDFRVLQEAIEIEYDLRLHMMRIGPRDRAKLVDGYDICGQRLCCSSWMTDFPKVGIRMAKAQDLSLNPEKISGVCGRLLCCLTFEFDVYKEMRGQLPKLGKHVSTPVGQGRVIAVSVPKQTVTVELEQDGRRVEVPGAEMGLAVRVEDAPNEALEETLERAQAERAQQARGTQRGDTPRGAAPPRAARRSEPARGSREGDAKGEPAAPRGRRRRRRGRGDEGAAPPDRGEGRPADAPTSDTPAGEAATNRARSEAGDDRGTPTGEAERAPRRRRRRPRDGSAGDGSAGDGSAGDGPAPQSPSAES